MIVGIIGVSQDVESVVSQLTQVLSVPYVDSTKFLRKFHHTKLIKNLTIQTYAKQYFLKKLERELGTVAVSGNILVDLDIAQWILMEGGAVVVVARKSLESYAAGVLEDSNKYYGDELLQQYELVDRYTDFLSQLQNIKTSGILYSIDLSDKKLASLGVSSLEAFINSSSWERNSSGELLEEDILELIDIGGVNSMNMEDTIKKAMQELGMRVEELPKKESKKKSLSKKQVEKLEKKKQVAEKTELPKEDTSPNSLVVKIWGDAMAILIPVGLELEKQIIDGLEFNVATVKVPDMSCSTLQELERVSSELTDEPEPVKPQPVKSKEDKKSKEEKFPAPAPEGLESLLEEKKRLDAEIKKYRQLGDIDTVNTLRKQRRTIRNKINLLKK